MSNAKRFGGAYSPGASGKDPAAPPPAPPAARSRFRWRVGGLYLAPTPLMLSGIWSVLAGDPLRMLWSWGGWAALIFAAWMTSEGVKAAAEFEARAIAKPPSIPRKLFGAGITGLAVAGVCFTGADLGLFSLAYGLVAAGAHVLAFGPDPMRARGGEGLSAAVRERVATKIDQAEAVVKETTEAATMLRDDALAGRINGLAAAARNILREIEADPRDLDRARRFLSVHLTGLRDAVVKYAAARAKSDAAELRPQFEALLADLEISFRKQRETLLADDQADLEIEISVLRDRLKQEGAL